MALKICEKASQIKLQLQYEKKKKILTGQFISDEYINQKTIEFAKELQELENKGE